MSKTWTKYKLTGPQLKRLSQICNDHDHLHGNALEALERKGLVRRVPDWTYPKTHAANMLGRAALEAARKEGW